MAQKQAAEIITYRKDGEWSGYTLERRPDGLWRYEGHSQIQGCTSGRIVILEAPPGLEIIDEADLDTLYTECMSKAEYLKTHGREVRCLRRGHSVR